MASTLHDQSEETEKKSVCCKIPYCRVYFGFFLSVFMLILGFVLIIVGGVRSYTALIILGVVFLLGSVAFVVIICFTKESIRKCWKNCIWCGDNTEEKYAEDNTEDDQSFGAAQRQTTSQDPAEDTTDNFAAVILNQGESSKDDNGAIQAFELK